MVRCKFKCTCINEYDSAYSYILNAVYGSEENRVYWESTPSGTFQVTINKSLGKLFEVGKEYLVDVVEVGG